MADDGSVSAIALEMVWAWFSGPADQDANIEQIDGQMEQLRQALQKAGCEVPDGWK